MMESSTGAAVCRTRRRTARMSRSRALTAPWASIRQRKRRLHARSREIASRAPQSVPLTQFPKDQSAFPSRSLPMRLRAFALSIVSAAVAGLTAAADAPGMKHQIRVQDMPKPYATPAVDNSSQKVPPPNGWLPHVAKGFAITAFASGLTNPRWMAVAANGDVFLSELRDENADGKADKALTFAQGFSRPHGLAFHNGALYVGDTDAVWRVAYQNGATQAGTREQITKQSFGGV